MRAALHALNHGVDQHDDEPATDAVAPERIAQYLRAVVTLIPAPSSPYGEAAAAVTAACADLDDDDLSGAYLALRAADSALHEAATAP